MLGWAGLDRTLSGTLGVEVAGTYPPALGLEDIKAQPIAALVTNTLSLREQLLCCFVNPILAASLELH